MKKIMIILMAAVVGMAACKKETTPAFNSNTQNIYFNLEPFGFKDSLLYTFANHPEMRSDTVWVPVRISGNRVDSEMTYAVKVIDSASTAQVNKHYQPLKDQYVLPANAGPAWLPVILYNTDTMMLKRSFSLTLQLVSTGNLRTDLTQQLTARIVFSNRLERPKWWDKCPLGGSSYSITKHLLFRLAATTEDVPLGQYDTPIWLYYTEKLNVLLLTPRTWIANNPGKGYDLFARPDGNYDFYNPAEPEKKFLYRKKDNTTSYFFVDENGNDVL